jgi:hypothetical protein
MTAVPPCGPFADAILDGAAPRPAGFDAHLASCERCRVLAAAERAARSLPAPEISRPVPIGEPEVRARVLRRRFARRVSTGSLAAGVAVLVFMAVPSAHRAPARPAGDLFALADELAALTRRDPMADAASFAGAGAVSDWLAPPRASALDLDSITPRCFQAATGGTSP